MSKNLKIYFWGLMSLALFFGFLNHFIPAKFPYNFERLHIFLFNLCSGGTIILFYSERLGFLSKRTIAFGLLSVIYALLAFLEIYPPAIIISLILAVIVESIRIRRYSLFPVGFFKAREALAEKFNQASLLCLSVGLVISSLVILNNEYLHWVYYRKMTLNTFFLGFSFPVSLITFSVIFRLMKNQSTPLVRLLKEFGFWAINLGVITFFIFIIFEKLLPQLFVTLILLMSVIMVFLLYCRLGLVTQQKNFLTSGMGFLLYTAITGIIYIVLAFFPEFYTHQKADLLLRVHSFASLYGWNLSGLTIICRYNDFPLRLHSRGIILFHWITVILLAPLGKYYTLFAAATIICYVKILWTVFFNDGKAVQSYQQEVRTAKGSTRPV